MPKTKLLVMDVDGTLTDGKIYMGPAGEVMKAFDIKDGYGIHEILPAHGIKTAILTGRTSEIVARRAGELEIDFLIQGQHDKLPSFKRLVDENGWNFDEIAYIGDDVLDLPCMELCGLRGCPADAVQEVRQVCEFVSAQTAGNGAVREFIEWLVQR